MPFSIIVAGSIAMTAQAAFLREILATFRGGELTIGTALLGWLLWTAIGSGPVAGLFSRKSNPDTQFHRLLPWFGAFAFCGVIVIRNVPLLIGLPSGEVVPYDFQFIAVLLAFAPCNIVGGILFVLGARSLDISKQTSVGSAFTFEAIGAATAGIFVSLLAIPVLSNTGVTLICPAMAFSTGVLRFVRNRDYRSLAVTIAPLILITLALSWSFQSKGYQYRGQELLAQKDTRYSRLRVTRDHEQVTCFADADVAFSVPDIESAEYSAHIPMLISHSPERVLVLGGCLNGTVDEILKYQSLKQITCVELDPAMFSITGALLEHPWKTDKRIEIVNSDSRAWLSKSENRYDVIIMSMPAPLSGVANRYYTREFFRLASERLTENGVFGFSLLGDENYLSDDMAYYLASIRSTLQGVFPAVVTLPGVKCRFIAGKKPGMLDGLSWESLEANRNRIGIETLYVRDYYLSSLLSQLRIESLTSSLDDITNPVVNTDIKPSGYVNRTIIQGSLDGSGTIRLIKLFLTPGVLWLFMTLILFTVVLSLLFHGQSLKRTIAITVGTVGMTEITLEILAIMAYQSIFGFLYGRIALLTGSYMGGLALGGWLGTRSVRKNTAGMRHLASVQALVAMLPVCWIVVLGIHTAFPGQIPLLELLFYVLTALAGIAGGFQFPVGDYIHCGIVSMSTYRAGTVYSLDLAGSSIGALIMASLMVPVLGMIPVLVFLALLNAVTASAVWFQRDTA